MPSLRYEVAKGAVRTINGLSRLTARGSGTVIGGRVGLAIAPGLLGALTVDRDVILVSGTNGKTTTSAMIAAGWGGTVARNATGSNMPAGHVAALVESASERTVLEVDESWLAATATATSPKVIVLLNLSRDQLDRANEVRRIAERWRSLVASLHGVTVVANANDPLVVYAAELAESVAWCDVPTPWTGDAISCPHCTRALHFEVGTWSSECGFSKPRELTTVLGDSLVVRGSSVPLALALPGEFNEVNAAMALTALGVLDVDLGAAAARVNAITDVAGRFSCRRWRGQRLRLLLAKNPAGFSALLASLGRGSGEIWIAINARLADGHDPSWLYDVPFEALRGRRVRCFGDRKLDLATRLDYAGVEYEVASDEVALVGSRDVIDLIANYTAFQEWLERSASC